MISQTMTRDFPQKPPLKVPAVLSQSVERAREQFDQAQAEMTAAEQKAIDLTRQYERLTRAVANAEDKLDVANQQAQGFQNQRESTLEAIHSVWGSENLREGRGYLTMLQLDFALADFKAMVKPMLTAALAQAKADLENFIKNNR